MSTHAGLSGEYWTGTYTQYCRTVPSKILLRKSVGPSSLPLGTPSCGRESGPSLYVTLGVAFVADLSPFGSCAASVSGTANNARTATQWSNGRRIMMELSDAPAVDQYPS